jgi:16S rRNA (guanine966-N2)-methyltransferase
MAIVYRWRLSFFVRIIAGEFRGRKLLPPTGSATRPVTDRVKQAIFDSLHSQGLIENRRVLDVFAGTGSFGLEALSRGAATVTFFEKDRSALDRLRRNLAAVAVDASIQTRDIYHIDAFPAADLAFLDPPYRHLIECPEKLVNLIPKLGPKVLLRHDAADPPPEVPTHQTTTRRWGNMAVTTYDMTIEPELRT